MAEIVGFAASTITLIATAYDAYQTLYSVLEGIQNASKCIDSLRRDVDDVCIVLGALQGLIEDEETSNGVSQSLTLESLTKILDHCIQTANDLKDMISDFTPRKTGRKLSRWRSGMWVVKRRVVEGYRRDLHEQKMTLSMALAVASWSNTNSLRATASEFTAYFRQLQEKLPTIIGDKNPSPSYHHQELGTQIQSDLSLPLNRYINTAVSIISSNFRPDPSLQISSLGVTLKTISASFKTAPTHRSNDPSVPSVATPCTSIQITDIGEHKLIDLSVTPTDTVEMLKEKVRLKIGLPTAYTEILYQRIILDHPTKSIEEYAIPNNTILRCVFFHPNSQIPRPRLDDIFIPSVDIIDNLFGLLRRTTIAVEIGDEVSHIKAKYANTRSETTEGLIFIYSGRLLNDSTLMTFDVFTTSVNARYVIHLMRNQTCTPAIQSNIDELEHTPILPVLSEYSELSKLANMPLNLLRHESQRSLDRDKQSLFPRRRKTSVYFRGLAQYFRPMAKWKKSVNRENLLRIPT